MNDDKRGDFEVSLEMPAPLAAFIVGAVAVLVLVWGCFTW